MGIPRILTAAPLALILPVLPAAAQDFYQGKTINVICGFAPGGGYDAYARLMSRHIGNHMPGKPSVVVQNMTGAGTVRASNHVYSVATKDGTYIAAVNQNMPMYQLLGGKAAQFEAGKLQWIGSLIGSNGITYTWHTSPTKTIEDAKHRETPLGGTGTNSDSHIYPTAINKLIGTRFKVINGYSGGTADIHIAVERGEVEGRGGNSWASLTASSKGWIEEKKINVLVQIGFEPEPELKSVPMLIDLVKSEEDRQIVRVISNPITIGYGYWLAPEVPADRIALLRKAFDQMAADKEFLAEADKLKMMIRPRNGTQLEKIVKDVAATPKPILQRTAEILEWSE